MLFCMEEDSRKVDPYGIVLFSQMTSAIVLSGSSYAQRKIAFQVDIPPSQMSSDVFG